MADAIFELILRGKDSGPVAISLHEMAELLEAFEDSLLPIIREQHPEIKPEAIAIGLTDIERGSLKLKFDSTLPLLAAAAFATITTAITTREFIDLPAQSAAGLASLVKSATRLQTDLDFYDRQGQAIPSASIHYEEPFDILGNLLVTGETDLYGKLLRVGGAEPRVAIRLDDERIFTDRKSVV